MKKLTRISPVHDRSLEVQLEVIDRKLQNLPVGGDRDEKGQAIKGGALHTKRRPQFYRVMVERAYKEGVDLEERIWRVGMKLLDLAAGGDVSAAKVVLERFTDSEPIELHISQRPNYTDTELVARMDALFDSVRQRVISEDLVGGDGDDSEGA